MHKAILLFVLALHCAFTLAATYTVEISNNNKSKKARFVVMTEISPRDCICVRNTQTGFIKGLKGGTIKLFSTSDCTGNSQNLGSNAEIGNTQWVNSFSFGLSGHPSSDPNGYCPNWYTLI
ncbi:hypothetical protein EC991_007731 [Linnemannia zychae]|nr:hypothetical protein EC991_007731 [Linnemannia zychae]